MRWFLLTSVASLPKTRAWPSVGNSRPEQQLDRRRLAGAVGAEQAEDFALLDFEVERFEGPHLLPAPEVAIDLREGPRFDDCFACHTQNPRSDADPIAQQPEIRAAGKPGVRFLNAYPATRSLRGASPHGSTRSPADLG